MQQHHKIDRAAAQTMVDPGRPDTLSVTISHGPACPPSDRSSMKLIPWPDIWRSLRMARDRGNGEMIEVFYDTLFKEAIFDDDGAWSLDLNKAHN